MRAAKVANVPLFRVRTRSVSRTHVQESPPLHMQTLLTFPRVKDSLTLFTQPIRTLLLCSRAHSIYKLLCPCAVTPTTSYTTAHLSLVYRLAYHSIHKLLFPVQLSIPPHKQTSHLSLMYRRAYHLIYTPPSVPFAQASRSTIPSTLWMPYRSMWTRPYCAIQTCVTCEWVAKFIVKRVVDNAIQACVACGRGCKVHGKKY